VLPELFARDRILRAAGLPRILPTRAREAAPVTNDGRSQVLRAGRISAAAGDVWR
jgi:hypothetical protein